ncbi:hypothetical protein ABZT51_41590 [Streptomyces sp. NPDC005373]|uniref:hypothetical protein n=1 Tax=unclassified Streptomyces TaxID=2593676 RepID=UPI00339DE257
MTTRQSLGPNTPVSAQTAQLKEKTGPVVLAAAHAPIKHGFAEKADLARLRTDPAHRTGLLRALLVLTNFEGDR